MTLTDTHTHIYSEEFDADLDEAIARAVSAGVTRMYLPAIDREHHGRLLAVADRHPGHCFPMIGLHPTSVKADYREELSVVEEYLAHPGRRFLAIGEIGIDLYWDRTHEEEQRIAFRYQLELAVRYGLPAVIHTRNSMDIALQIVGEMNEPGLRGIFHCFSGNVRQAEQAAGLGFLLGIGGVVTYKNSGLQAVVAHMPLESLVLETDAPWLPPVPYRGQRNEPAYLPFIAAKVAEIRGITPEEVANYCTGNATELFGDGP